MNTEKTRYATVRWSIEDVLSLRPEMTEEAAEKFLLQYEKVIQDSMLRAGWETIELLLFTEVEEPTKE